MGKRLTDKEKEERTVSKVLKRIKSLEGTYPQRMIERACFRYKDANLRKRNAEKEISTLQKQLEKAKKELN